MAFRRSSQAMKRFEKHKARKKAQKKKKRKKLKEESRHRGGVLVGGQDIRCEEMMISLSLLKYTHYHCVARWVQNR